MFTERRRLFKRSLSAGGARWQRFEATARRRAAAKLACADDAREGRVAAPRILLDTDAAVFCGRWEDAAKLMAGIAGSTRVGVVGPEAMRIAVRASWAVLAPASDAPPSPAVEARARLLRACADVLCRSAPSSATGLSAADADALLSDAQLRLPECLAALIERLSVGGHASVCRAVVALAHAASPEVARQLVTPPAPLLGALLSAAAVYGAASHRAATSSATRVFINMLRGILDLGDVLAERHTSEECVVDPGGLRLFLDAATPLLSQVLTGRAGTWAAAVEVVAWLTGVCTPPVTAEALGLVFGSRLVEVVIVGLGAVGAARPVGFVEAALGLVDVLVWNPSSAPAAALVDLGLLGVLTAIVVRDGQEQWDCARARVPLIVDNLLVDAEHDVARATRDCTGLLDRVISMALETDDAELQQTVARILIASVAGAPTEPAPHSAWPAVAKILSMPFAVPLPIIVALLQTLNAAVMRAPQFCVELVRGGVVVALLAIKDTTCEDARVGAGWTDTAQLCSGMDLDAGASADADADAGADADPAWRVHARFDNPALAGAGTHAAAVDAVDHTPALEYLFNAIQALASQLLTACAE
jgi:hypothetical protein